MKTGHLDGYKNLKRYVSTMLPIMPRYVPKRYKSYEKCCTSSTLASNGIDFGSGPELIPSDTAADIGEYVNAYFWSTKHTNAIYMEKKNCDKYEKKPEKYQVAIQYLLLHELIHWARFHAGAPAEINGAEAGNTFEVEAYGIDVSYLWDR